MKEDANDKLTSSSYSSTGTAVGSSVYLWSSMPFSASVMASLLIHLYLHCQLPQDSKWALDYEPLLTYSPPCGLPMPKATVKLGNIIAVLRRINDTTK